MVRVGLRLLFLGFVGALCIGSGQLFAQSQAEEPECSIPDFPAPELCARAGLGSLEASFVFVVDRSGSMQPLWPHVARALGSLAEAVPESDLVRLILFDEAATVQYWPWSAEPSVRQSWQRRMTALPAPTGRWTDLGSALERTLELMRAEPPDRQQFVFFLTDGTHDVAPSSSYDLSVGSAAWTRLSDEALTLAKARPLKFSVVRLGADADPSSLVDVLPDPVTIDLMTPSDLRSWFGELSREFQVEKLRLAIAGDRLIPAVSIRSRGGFNVSYGRNHTVDLTVSSRRRLLGFAVDTAVLGLGPNAQVRLEPFRTSPDTTITVEASVTDVSVNPVVPPAWVDRDIDTVAVVPGTLLPANELSRIGISPASTESIDLELDYSAGGIVPWWWLYILGVLVLIGAIILLVRTLRRASHRPRLDGYRLLRYEDDPGSVGESVELEGTHQTIRGEDGKPLFQLTARNEKGRTAIAFESLVEIGTVSLKPDRANPRDLKPNNSIVVAGDGVSAEFRLMKASR